VGKNVWMELSESCIVQVSCCVSGGTQVRHKGQEWQREARWSCWTGYWEP